MMASAMFIPQNIIALLQLMVLLDSMPTISAAYAVEEPMTSLKLTKSLLRNVKTQTMVLLMIGFKAAEHM